MFEILDEGTAQLICAFVLPMDGVAFLMQCLMFVSSLLAGDCLSYLCSWIFMVNCEKS